MCVCARVVIGTRRYIIYVSIGLLFALFGVIWPTLKDLDVVLKSLSVGDGRLLRCLSMSVEQEEKESIEKSDYNSRA